LDKIGEVLHKIPVDSPSCFRRIEMSSLTTEQTGFNQSRLVASFIQPSKTDEADNQENPLATILAPKFALSSFIKTNSYVSRG
jgi:hypothetical protein